MNIKSKIAVFVLLISVWFSAQRAEAQQNVTNMSLGEGIKAVRFYASTVDDDNNVWFLTESGIVSYNGTKWTIHNRNRKVSSSGLKGVVYDFSSYGPELWLATEKGATVVSLPVDARSGATTYYPDNSKLPSENVLAVAVGKKELRWFGTDKGISAFKGRKWLTNSYARKYPDGTFEDFPITSLA
ncbi:MAG: hypothetical protein GYA43_03170, partial [Bacteroidales bacterium]|nr:hypothetical protein [Bacteroidales bacterium]